MLNDTSRETDPGEPAGGPVDDRPLDRADDRSPDAPEVVAGEPRRGMLLALLALPVVLIVAVVIGGVVWSRSTSSAAEPLGLPAVPSPGGDGKYCAALYSALPSTLGGQPRRTLVGDPQDAAAWGDPAIVLRCGLPTPAELTCSSQLTAVSGANGLAGVLWLQLSEGGQTTYLAADRPVRIALTLPDGAGSAAIQDLSAVIAGTMPSTARADGKLCTGGRLPATQDG